MAVDRQEALQALQELLVDLFDSLQLRMLIEKIARKLVRDLPGESVSLNVLAHEIVDGLERHGLVDERLFHAILAERAARSDRIEQVMALFAITCPAARSSARIYWPVPAQTPDVEAGAVDRWRQRFLWARTAAGFFVGVLLLTRCYPKFDASQGLAHVERQCFSFLPQAYRTSGLIWCTLLTMLVALTCWLVTRRAQARLPPKPFVRDKSR